MATLVLGTLGSAIGGAVGGSILGLSGAVIGGAIGTAVGSVADAWLAATLAPRQRIEGARLESLRFTSSGEGAVLSRVWGRHRLGGTLIWATDFRETAERRRQRVSKFQRVAVTEYRYTVSFAVALCEGPITGIGRVWADGEPMDLDGTSWRWYPGDEAQDPDPIIAATVGIANAPAYRGTAYVVFEDLDLEPYGNRVPQLSFEVFRPLAEPDTAEGALRAITLIPGAGEFVYATDIVRRSPGTDAAYWRRGGLFGRGTSAPPAEGNGEPENEQSRRGTSDFVVALDQLQACAPALESVSLVVTWFGDDLRAGHCRIRPKVDRQERETHPPWVVNGLTRADADPVIRIGGEPAYGGTPADFAVVQAIREIKARGLRVTFYPFLMMDIGPGNTLPDPYSDHAAGVGQPVLPWRGRITCSPAAGYAGTVDATAAAAAQVASFFGDASPLDFAVSGSAVTWTGPAGDWGLRRMILHYAHLCAAAGGVDAFLIGTEMRGLTWIRDGASSYPAVAALRALAADVRSILGPATKVSYAADWSEYFGHQPPDGSGDVHFHLDPLWADANIDFIGIDNYMPLSDWRDGFEHLDARQGWPGVHDRAYLSANIASGEGFDWYYATAADRASQVRTPITDGAYGKPWVFRYKDLRNWWSNEHFDRPGGVESASPTAWVPQSKPIRFTEFGCPAVDRGTNQPNVFYDPKSSESFLPYFSRGWRDDAIQRSYIEAMASFWQDAAHNPASTVYDAPMVDWSECAAWTWDARPYPAFPTLSDVWADAGNWRLGHWLTGRLSSASLSALVRDLCRRAGLPAERIDVSGLWGAVEGFAVPAVESPRASIATLARAFGFDAVESGGVIRFVMRGRGPVARVALDDMGAPGPETLPLFEPAVSVAQGSAEDHELARAQESELPASLRWTVARSDDDRYESAVVEATRAAASHSRVEAEAFAAAIPPEEAERLCRRALAETWTGRETLTLRLPPSALALDPTDTLLVAIGGHELQFRLVSVADGVTRTVEAVRQDREDRDTGPAPGRAARLSRPLALAAPTVAILDVPQVHERRDAHRPLIAATAQPWPGTFAVFASPDGTAWELLRTFGMRAQLGRLVEDLPAAREALPQRGDGALVEIDAGALASVSEMDLLGGANMLALEHPEGWELMQFRDAVLVAPRTWRLRRLLRGQRGTEWAIRDPAPADARVVVLDPALPDLPVALATLGQPRQLRIGPASRPLADATYASGGFTPAGVGLRPFAPVHLRARREGADLRLSWVRRDRALDADSWLGPEVPLSEAGEAWTIEILDGTAVRRTLSSAGAAVLYTAAQQTADWGAPLGPGGSLRFRVTQLSARVGAGTPATTLLIV